MKRRVEAGNLRHGRISLCERFDQRDFRREVNHVQRLSFAQFFHHRWIDRPMRCQMNPAMNDAMSDAIELRAAQMRIDPVHYMSSCSRMIPRINGTPFWIAVLNRCGNTRARLADALDFAAHRSLWRVPTGEER